MLIPFACAAFAASSAWALLAVVAVWRTTRLRTARTATTPGVTVLKPLSGVDPELEANLRSFFEQDYGRFELVFGVEGEGGAEAALVTRLQREYPRVPATLVRHDGGSELNPKVRNLQNMLPFAHHDVLVVSDSNVRVSPRYLRRMIDALNAPGTGIVTHLVSAPRARTLGGALEAAIMNATVAAGVAVPTTVLGFPTLLGKSMMFRRSELDALGGLARVGSLLAEDYVLGRMFHEARLRVRLLAGDLETVSAPPSVAGVFGRQLRWAMLRCRLQPTAFLAEPLTAPLVAALVGALMGLPLVPLLAAALALTTLRDAALWWLLRREPPPVSLFVLAPLRELVLVAAWALAPFRRHVRWRGRRVRVSAGTVLYREVTPGRPVPAARDRELGTRVALTPSRPVGS